MAEVFEKALDISLDKKDPKRKLERRLEKERKRSEAREKDRPDEVREALSEQEPTSEKEDDATSRYIPSEVGERVFARASWQCEFRGEDGTRCSARTGLEIEHERPFAIYRTHEERHLRALCRRHNRLQAERVYGAELIQARIDARKHADSSLRPTSA